MLHMFPFFACHAKDPFFINELKKGSIIKVSETLEDNTETF